MYQQMKSFPGSIFASGEAIRISGDKDFYYKNQIHAELFLMDGEYYRLSFIEYIRFRIWFKKTLPSFTMLSDSEYFDSLWAAMEELNRR